MSQTEHICGVNAATEDGLWGITTSGQGLIERQGSRRLRVLIYTTLFPNSVQPLQGNFVLERMRHLLPFIDMSVVAPIPYFPRVNLNERWFKFASVPRNEQFGGFEVDHPRYIVVPKLGMATHGVSMFAGSFRRVCARLRATDFDLIDAHYVYPDGLAATLLGAALKKPVVVSARGTDINVFPQLKTIRPLIRRVLTHADAVIAVAQSLKDNMLDLGCPGEKITVLQNGVDAEKFKPLPALYARHMLALPSDRPIVLGVGQLTQGKGFHILIEAVARLRSHHPDVLLLLVGEGPYRSALEKQIRDLGVSGNVRLAGSQPHDRLALWYSASNVFCLPSSTEGCPNVVLEAMACGLPVVATRVGGIPDAVVSPAMGTLVDRTVEAFEQAIGAALFRRWDHDSIVAHARTHDWSSVALKTLSLYTEVLARRRSQFPHSSSVQFCPK
jgi:glycosyltransferase involved in cell wall biosynthesis